MSDVAEVPVADLEELLEQEIPCGGLTYRPVRRSCGKSAAVRWTSPHGNDHPGVKAQYKCMDCWMVLYQRLADELASEGYLVCGSCGHVSHHVLAHTDYRPF